VALYYLSSEKDYALGGYQTSNTITLYKEFKCMNYLGCINLGLRVR
jgi:hypothetical protein